MMLAKTRFLVFVLCVGIACTGLTVSAQDKKDPKKDETKKEDPKKGDAKKEEPKKDAAGVEFELYKDSAGEFRFRLKDGDTLLATSGKGYKAKADCQKVVDTIKKEAAKAKVVDEAK